MTITWGKRTLALVWKDGGGGGGERIRMVVVVVVIVAKIKTRLGDGGRGDSWRRRVMVVAVGGRRRRWGFPAARIHVAGVARVCHGTSLTIGFYGRTVRLFGWLAEMRDALALGDATAVGGVKVAGPFR